MDSEQLRALLARLGLTQGAAARLLGIDARTIRKWCSGERGMPEPARRLLLGMEQVPALRSWLQNIPGTLNEGRESMPAQVADPPPV